MGIPMCEFKTFSQAVDIPPDSYSKGPRLRDHPFPAQSAPCPWTKHNSSWLDGQHDTAWDETLLRQVKGPIFSGLCFLTLMARVYPVHNPNTPLSRHPPRKRLANAHAGSVRQGRNFPNGWVQLRSGTASRRNAIYNRTDRLSLGPKPSPIPSRDGSARLCRSKRPRQPM